MKSFDAYIFAYQVYADLCGGQMKIVDPLELKLQMAMNHLSALGPNPGPLQE